MAPFFTTVEFSEGVGGSPKVEHGRRPLLAADVLGGVLLAQEVAARTDLGDHLDAERLVADLDALESATVQRDDEFHGTLLCLQNW